MNSKNSINSMTPEELLKQAELSGNLSPEALSAINNITDMGAELQNAMGISIDNVDASEVVLIGMLIDDSGSIRMSGNTETVRKGYNLVIDSVKQSKQGKGVLALTRYLNGTMLYPWIPIDQAVMMDAHNYNPNGGTPLYDESVIFLGTLAVKAEEFESLSGTPVRSITLIVTDGADVHSQKQNTKSVKAVVDSLLKTENHIVAAMGIDDGSTDFRRVFSEMGIPDEWILTPGNTESEIRKAFQLFSQSAVRASQNAASFSQAAMGGFGG